MKIIKIRTDEVLSWPISYNEVLTFLDSLIIDNY